MFQRSVRGWRYNFEAIHPSRCWDVQNTCLTHPSSIVNSVYIFWPVTHPNQPRQGPARATQFQRVQQAGAKALGSVFLVGPPRALIQPDIL